MVCVPDYCLLVITCNLQCEGHTEWEDERREEQAIDYSLTKFGGSILFVIKGNLYVSKLAINKPNKNLDVVMISEKVLSKVSVSYKQNKSTTAFKTCICGRGHTAKYIEKSVKPTI